jgi:regulator of cell morphogenesis and NO signaling
MTIATAKTVGEMASTIPGASRVFEKFKIDYCCGGRRSLDEACAAAGVKVSEVVQSLEEARPNDARAAGHMNYRHLSLSELIAHILDSHHVFTKQEMLRLGSLLHKVIAAHGVRHPELRRLQGLFEQLIADLSPHMMKEENVLFPYILKLEQAALAQQPLQRPPFMTVQNPIRMMLMEHETVGDLLREIRVVTSAYTVPADACISYQTLYQAMEEFERDLHQHIHLENNILFPRALELEGRGILVTDTEFA